MRVSPEAELSAGDQKWDEAQGFNELSSNTLWGRVRLSRTGEGEKQLACMSLGFVRALVVLIPRE